MKKKVMMAAACAAFCGILEAASVCVGDWALDLPFPDNRAGWLRIGEGETGATASLMWRWTGPNDLVGKKYKGEVAIDGDSLSVRYLSTHWISKPEDQRWISLKGRVNGDRIALVYTETDGNGKVTDGPDAVSGKRLPPFGPKPDLSKARYGCKIEMWNPDLWENRNPDWHYGWTFDREKHVISNRILRDTDGKPQGKGANIVTKRRDFYDFQLIFDVRMPKGCNSGVYLRGNYEIQMMDTYGQKPDSHNMGALYGRIVPRIAAEKPAGEWQKMRVYLYKRHLTVVLNGERIIDNEPVEGVTGGALTADDFATGPLGLQGDHSDVDFRDFLLVPILSDEVTPCDVIPKPQTAEARPGALALQPGIDYRGLLDAGWTTDPSIPAEGYRLEVTPTGIAGASSDAAGRFYAAETLRQMTTKANGATVIPCVKVEDFPRFRYRGLMVDEARHFFGKNEMKRVIDKMARYKLNRLHWHLADDQGWRIESKRHPELMAVATWRSESPMFENDGLGDGEKYGPYFYTQEELKDIIAYAAARHVEIVPEVDMPGHMRAALAACPQYTCTGKGFEPKAAWNRWGISDDVLCLGNPDAVRFAEDILDELCEIFPGKTIHIGGDECPHKRWKACPKCQAKIKELGLKDESALQGWFSTHLSDYLEKKGRRAMGWDEVLSGLPSKNLLVQNWREGAADGSLKGVQMGHEMVMSPTAECYYTIKPGVADDPMERRSWAWDRVLTLETQYNFSPVKGIPAELRHLVVGGEACAWTEATRNRCVLEWKVFPRLCALAEALWTAPEKRDFAEFERRAAKARKELMSEGINCSPLR